MLNSEHIFRGIYNVSSHPIFALKIKTLLTREVVREVCASLDSDPEFARAGVIFEADKDSSATLSVPRGSVLLTPSSHYHSKILGVCCRAYRKYIYISRIYTPYACEGG